MRLENAVGRLLLEALAPVGMEAMIEAAESHIRATEEEKERWSRKVERARYEVELSTRQYDEVDPANRLVARELERRWEKALKELEEIETEFRMKALEKPLTSQETQKLRQYAEDMAGLWNAATTRSQDKKRIIRCLIENIVVRSPKTEKKIEADIHWSVEK